jgi:hypothetical protein
VQQYGGRTGADLAFQELREVTDVRGGAKNRNFSWRAARDVIRPAPIYS